MADKKTGRPKLHIDWSKVDAMLEIQCTGEEIASVLDVSYDTIERRCKAEKKMSFADYSDIKRQSGRASLRRRQFAMSENNPTMAIWLGKQWLGQSDKIESKSDDTVTIKFIDDSFEGTSE